MGSAGASPYHAVTVGRGRAETLTNDGTRNAEIGKNGEDEFALSDPEHDTGQVPFAIHGPSSLNYSSMSLKKGKRRDSNHEYVNARDLPLNEWLVCVFAGSSHLLTCCFPSERHAAEYLSGIERFSEQDVIALIREFLIPSCWLGSDGSQLKNAIHRLKHLPQHVSEFDRRVVAAVKGGKLHPPPWEGITWVIDLLPDHPRHALEVIDAYFIAHAQELPDGRLSGLGDAADLIRAKFIGLPDREQNKLPYLLQLPPREVEKLVAALYKEMGYTTSLTPAQKDGGRDVLATRQSPGQTEQLRIEVKRYCGSVGVGVARQLLGVVSDEKVNKGIVGTTGYFTKTAKEFAARNPRLELVPGAELVVLLNKYFGARWPMRISWLIR